MPESTGAGWGTGTMDARPTLEGEDCVSQLLDAVGLARDVTDAVRDRCDVPHRPPLRASDAV